MNLDVARALYPEAKELTGLISEEWLESYNLGEGRAEICLRDTLTGEVYPIAQVLPTCTFDDRRLMFKAPALLRAVVTVCEAAFVEIRRLKPTQKGPDPKDFAAEVSMKCANDHAFRRYLIECHDLKDAGDTERVKSRVRSVLAVSSLKELNDDRDAGARWVSLRTNFKTWLRDKR
ncbi:hypothetical protein J2T09_002324 [Neorhizobium huautlense]|uniref:Uncharacterized protein n=1 Tax=Neorhizobium huautlense TaxID=67774 RepID=A0ABT9PSY5_9HYPH|nr:hypothetical protein [Neorhizobium huautlense]MDP9837572.1 hypothetical protein [Neorhizobium huautlense]